jgi:hypothetical protein
MPEYRFYIMTKEGKITAPPANHELPNDKAADEKAKQLVNGHAVEVWQGARIVAHLDPK